MARRAPPRPRPAPAGNGEDPRLARALERLEGEGGGSLRGASLCGAAFTGKLLPGPGPFDFTGADLRGASFEAVNLSKAVFAEADLSGASFRNVNLTKADFRAAAARGALFADVNLVSANFAGADLAGGLIFDANMADVSFKGAELTGAEVDSIRLSLNGATHVLGLKEALRALAQEESYPYIAGISGDAFWLSYYTRTRELNWGSFAKDSLRRGLENFGFRCDFADEVELDAAWETLRRALADGRTVITPLHVSAATTMGTGFGGAEWVFVTGIDRGDVLVNCLLGDAMRFPPARFQANWCLHHPLEEATEDLPIIYAMCLVGPRERVPARVETARLGLRGAVEILTLGSTEKVVFGFDAYTAMIQDLLSPAGPEHLPREEARRFLPWLGLDVLHHHGSRWAARDFLAEVLARGDLPSDEREPIEEARQLYAEVCTDLQQVLDLLPWSFDLPEGEERDTAIRDYHRNRERAADLLRSAAARERDALARFRAVIEPS